MWIWLNSLPPWQHWLAYGLLTLVGIVVFGFVILMLQRDPEAFPSRADLEKNGWWRCVLGTVLYQFGIGLAVAVFLAYVVACIAFFTLVLKQPSEFAIIEGVVTALVILLVWDYAVGKRLSRRSKKSD